MAASEGRRPHVLLAATGSVAAMKFAIVATGIAEFADVRTVATKSGLFFIDRSALPANVPLLTDEEEWSSWRRLGDTVLHIELRQWADLLVIAPLSANTMAKIANGMCDNLLTCVVRAWDYTKPVLVAPSMNTMMWDNPFSAKHLSVLDELGVRVVPPISKKLACGEVGNGAMAEPGIIVEAVRSAAKALPSCKAHFLRH
ncbi:hypothetical protein CBR_g28078 [Chara braunii]|uniref:phosphopantothenoylcysteine decarboxylase n=1 Tax=Chara braunii TaxID=69332 RepID=A0A388L9I7_CHABU|nr:hypothetical protein CBR_g28078 [Chara braunii]|eukprot:GBG78853.1 hypothetical protein CBR_g28078 [Chara braunii]